MSTATAQKQPRAEAKKKNAPKVSKRRIALATFLERYSDREDPFKYEWNNGQIEQSERTMNRDQLTILQALMQLFVQSEEFKNGALLASEVDMFLPNSNRTRRPDIAYLSPQLMEAAKTNEPTICPFVIEIISKNDQINTVQAKTHEYFENGVELVWLLFPNLKTVHIYRSPKDITVCMDGDSCSGAPVLEGFEIGVVELFGGYLGS